MVIVSPCLLFLTFFLVEDYNASFSLKEQVAYFMTLFRCSLPELCNYFEDEEVDIHEWSTSWLQNLLSKEMRFDNLVRLWGNEKKKKIQGNHKISW